MLRILAPVAVILLAAFAACAPAHAEDKWKLAPEQFWIGYEDEGKVDTSSEACESFVREMTLWSEDEIQRGGREVCAARKRHVDAYAAIQKSYKALMTQIGNDNRLNPAGAAERLAAMIRACIDHKWSLTTGGHNIRVDIIPNEIAAMCLNVGKSLLDRESEWFSAGYSDARPTP